MFGGKEMTATCQLEIATIREFAETLEGGGFQQRSTHIAGVKSLFLLVRSFRFLAGNSPENRENALQGMVGAWVKVTQILLSVANCPANFPMKAHPSLKSIEIFDSLPAD